MPQPKKHARQMPSGSDGSVSALETPSPGPILVPDPQKVLLVAGAHRSGTSALTRTLSLLGGSLASELLEAVPGNNERGFWEPKEIVELHDRALSSAGSQWDDVTRFPESWFRSDVARHFRRELGALLTKEFKDVPLFAVKDPRICRLLPLWTDTLEEIGVQPLVILPIRNPMEVARSLHKRDQFPLAKGYLIWLRHVLDAERDSRPHPRVLVHYEDLLEDWRGTAERIGNALGIHWPRMSSRAEAEIEEFLSADLRHQRVQWSSTGVPNEIPEWVVATYEALRGSSLGDPRLVQQLDQIRLELDKADSSFGRALMGVGIELTEQRSQASKLTLELAQAQAMQEALREEMQAKLAENEVRHQALHQASRVNLAENEARHQALHQASRVNLAENEARHQALHQEMQAKLAENEARRQALHQEMQAKLAESEARHHAQNQQREAKHQQARRDLESELAWIRSNAEAYRQRALRDIDQLNDEIQRLNDQVGHEHYSWAQAEELRVQEHARLQEILHSRSWTITAPLRSFSSWAVRSRALAKRTVGRLLIPLSQRPSLETGAYMLRHAPLPRRLKTPLVALLKRHLGHHLTKPLIGTPGTTSALVDRVAPWNGDATAVLPPETETSDRLLVVDWRVPKPDQDSGSYRITRILQGLRASGALVDFAADLPVDEPRYAEALAALDIHLIVGRADLLAHLQKEGGRYHTVVLSRPEVAHDYLPMVRAFATRARVIYDTVDLHWVRFQRGEAVLDDASHLGEKAERYKRMEIANARAADITLAITEEEKTELLRVDPSLPVSVVPNIHHLPEWPVPGFGHRQDLLFIGGFAHEPNVDAVHYFVREILPLIRDVEPRIVFRIIGSEMPSSIRKLHSLQVDPIGFVPVVDPYFSQARVFVAPLRHGAGMKGKVGQALSFGLPVVTTSIGAEGIGLFDGENALVADEPAAFAERVLRAYTDATLWETLSRNGRKIIEDRFSDAAVRPRLLELLAPGHSTADRAGSEAAQ